MVVALRNLARSQLAIRLAIMDALEGFRRLLRCQALERRNTARIGILVELEAAVDALLGRHDRSLRILRRELLLHHALLIALKVERRQKLVLDPASLTFSRRVTVFQGLLNHLFVAYRLIFIVNELFVLQNTVNAGLSRG